MDQQLLVFVTVVEKKNFSRAAEELLMTQPAVSQYVQALERSFGTRLLERNNKFVRLTKAGEIVYHHAKEIISSYNRMKYLVDDMLHVASGTIAIGASYTYGEYILPHVIASLQKRYPLIQPSIKIGNTREIAESVLNHEIDVGVIEGKYHHDNLYIEPIADDEMVVVASSEHPLATKDTVTVADLAEERWIVREMGSGTRDTTDRMFAVNNLQPANLMEFGSTQLIKESVEAGLGISLLSEDAIRKEVTLGTLQILPATIEPVIRQFTMITLASHFQTKAVEMFVDLLRSSSEDIAFKKGSR
ncbi:LysR family transcriptional regulator [Brevibacillus sp. SYSU BS000544]|uniref:LysR family transcriptional regulator n=1 Tax=Brevibacillus sp. SYSU BS000544 TaxID=3416443 RepID=UPI003CE4FA80